MSTETLISQYPLKREKIIKKTLGWVVGLVFGAGIFSLVIGAVAVAFIPLPVVILLVLIFLLVLLGIAYWYESEYFKKYFYDLTEEGIVISKGVFTTHRIIVPPQKVQDVYLDQDVLDRVFGLWDLHISSATESSGADAHIDGVSRESALALREILMKALLPEKAVASQMGEKPASSGAVFADVGGSVLKEIKPSSNGLFGVILAGIAFAFIVFMWTLQFSFLIAILAAFIIGLGALAWSYLDFTVLRYELREDGVFIRSGFITRSESLFLYKNIQDVEETAGLWDQILGLKALSIKTMTASSVTAAKMVYLDASVAPALRAEIIALAKKESGKAQKSAKEEKVPLASIAQGISVFAAAVEKEAPEKPKIEEKVFPYPNNFYKGSSYYLLVYGAVIWAVILLVALTLTVFGQGVLAAIGASIAIGITILGVVVTYFTAFLMVMSYSYTISTDFILIKTGILNIIKKQVNYGKIQDLEKSIGFSQSFAKLATIKLETGSREIVNKNQTGSAVTQNETIPDLNEKDAEELKHTALRQMGLSFGGIGANPLVLRLPLEAVKPLKKTFWWVFYSVVILALLTIGSFALTSGINWVVLVAFLFLASACVLKYLYEYYYYKKYFYDLNEDVLVIKKGVFGSRELIVPFEKIQDVFIDRDWLDLAFGLYDVYVTTVSSRSILNAHIDGLNEKNAEAAAELLLKKIKA
ncbi:MAG: PH domain-containing protein [Candidatus Micrarchaeota archaeon]